jgi:DTW domain-containing protein YfiP
MRPEVVCYCAHVTRLETRTRVVILQHPRERHVPINTARIAKLCLPDAEIRVGTSFDAPFEDAALLWPADDAIDVAEMRTGAPLTLVVVDGTWWQAKKLVRASPALRALPRVAFRPHAPSEYRIRREPREEYVSTIEALAHVLGVLEGAPDRFAAMLTPFRAMVDAQLAYAERFASPRRLQRPRSPRVRDPRARLPAILRERAGDLVCLYAESDAWPYGTSPRPPEKLVQLAACRVATGETFTAFASPERPLCPTTTFHLGVDEAAIASAPPASALLEGWWSFLRETDVVATWGDHAASLLALPKARVDLRTCARLWSCASVGTMDAFCTHLDATRPPPLAPGRAGERLATLVAIARALA